MNEVAAAFARLRLFNVSPDRSSGPQVLFANNPSCPVFLFLEMLVELNRP